MKGLSIGRIVHYRLSVDDLGVNSGIRPAIITHVWNDEGLVNLVIFLDGSYDRTEIPTSKTSVLYAPEDKVGYWHWPKQV